MGTRGVTGFIVDGVAKINYQQYDSYPEGVGAQVAAFLMVPGAIADAYGWARALRVVSQDSIPTQEDVEKLAQFTNLGVGTQSPEDWYCLLRDTQGNPAKILEAGVVVDHESFLLDSLWCEWGWIINLDANVVEVYQGFQQSKHDKGRYANGAPYTPDYHEADTYYPCALVLEVPFEDFASYKSPDDFVAVVLAKVSE